MGVGGWEGWRRYGRGLGGCPWVRAVCLRGFPCPSPAHLPRLRMMLQTNDLEQQPGRTIMESFENQVCMR